MKKGITFAFAVAMILTISMSAYAGEWKQDTSGMWYQYDDGNYPINQWKEIDGKQYYFDQLGYKLTNSVTPDGKIVGADGAEIVYNGSSYQTILDYYSMKIKLATPYLVSEYNEEAKRNTDGLMGLAELCSNKTMKLAEIETEGVGKMAELYFNSGSGSYNEYEEWAEKLYDVYSDEGEKIWNAYMVSAS